MKSEDWNLANARVTVLGIPRKADTVFSGSVRLTKRSRGESSSESSVATSVNLMDVDASHSIPKLPLPSEDEILVQMIERSGASSYSEIVNFCRSAGIPLSRMFRLDLMRKSSPA
ncbi:predicted protein [Phaeodactylum tricornutum CCAP 1055/1]|jgi:guanyl-specific ribonuclease Sa|uniref:Uncharacterized protein n=3 Tax=Phaeodactylum tricornutum TaxID=2850 RepID=B7FUQ6_PHATC|nr:predicted protein [Phaeodactylum tricornutum CCAP 1055/1]EEC50304.1 predicted protein [Phaeodactylum tricornutum CCAP 1055/1]|eukprot:XP_002178639.1 predicted protein [Phaeodactylum tricornutum CCAP 1055/1]